MIIKIRAALQMAAAFAGEELLRLQPWARKAEERLHDFDTDADHMSDEIIRDILEDHIPEIPILSEVGGGEECPEGELVIADELDGTVNYFHQDSLWAVSLAYVENGVSEIGVANLPGLRLMFSATRGEGNPVVVKKMHGDDLGHGLACVSQEKNLSVARVWTDWVKGENDLVYKILPKLHQATTLPGIRNCAVGSLVHVAMGKVDGYVMPGPKPEDIAAAALVVEMAGGRVTELDGKPWNAFSKTIVATNGLIHDELLDVLNQ